MAKYSFDEILSRAGFTTYEQAADKAGISRHSLWRWRTDAPPKRKSTAIVALANVLRVTPKELLASFRRRRHVASVTSAR